jgi:hypothetical protein
MKGFFQIGNEILPNTIVQSGEQAFLAALTQGDLTNMPAVGGNFYLGLCGLTFAINLTLAGIVGEPSATNGYARQAIVRGAGGWTISLIGNIYRARSSQVNFAAVGGNYSTTIRRAFLCSVAAGTAGTLYAISAPLSVDTLITPTTPLPVQYSFHLRS